MWNSYFSYLDYLELRRRVERRLSGSLWLFIHVMLFAFTPLVAVAVTPYWRSWWWGDGFNLVLPWIAYGMMGWSVALLLHGLWTYFRSGAWGSRRSQLIETEMRQRVQHEDSYLVQDDRDLFRLHGLLEEDVRKRGSAAVIPLAVFTVVNAVNWLMSGGGLSTSYPWQITPAIVLLILLPVLGFRLWGENRRQHKLMQMMASGVTAPAVKPKREALRFAGDNELLDIIEDDEYEKPKRLTR